jgi:hypothetical protein
LKYYIGNRKGWNIVATRFWKFIHETDVQLQPLFAEQWATFGDGIVEHVTSVYKAEVASKKKAAQENVAKKAKLAAKKQSGTSISNFIPCYLPSFIPPFVP